MKHLSLIFKLALPALLFFAFLAGCTKKEPVTIVFTGDTQGHLVPAG